MDNHSAHLCAFCSTAVEWFDHSLLSQLSPKLAIKALCAGAVGVGLWGQAGSPEVLGIVRIRCPMPP